MKFNKGFTLIELLVVIAIIGILSSVVLASLTSARSKGTDAAIQNELANMRAQAELHYSTYNSYGTTASCDAGMFNSATSTGSLNNLVDDVESKNGSESVICHAVDTTWAVSTVLPGSDSNQSWCVDSTGKSASSTAQTTGLCS